MYSREFEQSQEFAQFYPTLKLVPSSNSKIKKHSKLAMRASIIMAMVIADEPQLLNSK